MYVLLDTKYMILPVCTEAIPIAYSDHGLPPSIEIRPHAVGPFSEMTLLLLTGSRQFLGLPCFLCSGYQGFFSGVKQLMCDDRSPLSSAKVKNEWSYTFIHFRMPS